MTKCLYSRPHWIWTYHTRFSGVSQGSRPLKAECIDWTRSQREVWDCFLYCQQRRCPFDAPICPYRAIPRGICVVPRGARAKGKRGPLFPPRARVCFRVLEGGDVDIFFVDLALDPVAGPAPEEGVRGSSASRAPGRPLVRGAPSRLRGDTAWPAPASSAFAPAGLAPPLQISFKC